MYDFRDFIEYFFYCYGLELIGMTLAAVFGGLGIAAKRIYKAYVDKQGGKLDREEKIAVARIVVQFVEQVWKALHGPEKLRKALEAAQVLLAKKGIEFDADEMEIYIEAAVAEFNEAFRKPLDSENANASRDNTEDTEDAGASIADTVEEIMTTLRSYFPKFDR